MYVGKEKMMYRYKWSISLIQTSSAGCEMVKNEQLLRERRGLTSQWRCCG